MSGQGPGEVQAFIADLRRRGAQFHIDADGQLVVRAPRGVLTDHDRELLRRHKAAIIAWLMAEARGDEARRAFQERRLSEFRARGVPAWPLPCGCVGFRCPCCGGDTATLGSDVLCRYGNARDGRHRWLVREHAPA